MRFYASFFHHVTSSDADDDDDKHSSGLKNVSLIIFSDE
jgi:hypothetical protein